MLSLGPLPRAARSLAFHPESSSLYAIAENTPGVWCFDLLDKHRTIEPPKCEHPLAALTVSGNGRVLAGAPIGKPVWNLFWEIEEAAGKFFEIPERGQMAEQFPQVPLELNNHGGPGWPAFQLFQRENPTPWEALGMCEGERRSLLPGMVLCAPKGLQAKREPYLRGRRASRDFGDPGDVRDFEPITIWNGLLRAFALSPDGEQMAMGFKDGSVILRDWPGSAYPRFVWHWGIGAISSLAFSPDGQLLAAGGERSILVWDVEAA